MKIKSKIGQALAMATVLGSVATVGLISGGTASADLGTGNTISVTSGNNGTTFSLNVVAPSNACQGDTATGGYRFHQYITTADPATLGFAAGAITAPGGAFVQPLYSTTGSPQINKATAINTGQLIGLSTLNFNTNTLPGNGAYNIGFICVLGGVTTRHWVTPITVSGFVAPGTFNWTFGAVPGAPTATAVGGDGVITGSITALTATPSVTGYTVTATRTGGTADASSPRTTSVGAGAGAYSLAAVNGATYSVAITATNSVGTGAATTVAPVNVNFTLVSPAPVVTAANGPSPINGFQVTASTGTLPAGVTLVNHVVTFTPQGGAAALAGSPFTVTGSPATLPSLTGVAGSSYTYSVVGNYSDGRTSVAATGTLSFTSAQQVIQNITVVRPQGALVLTQRCGVFGSAAQYVDTTFGTLGPLAATPADADTLGALPQAPVGPTAPTLGLGGAADPLASQYPYPVDSAGIPNPNYPTNCAIDLGIGQLITSGPRAGQYFKATGRIAQITVVNTRDTDTGWTLNGRMSDFTSTTDATDTFSGNLLGWNPEVTWDSSANLDGYDMTVTAGGIRQPVSDAANTGLGEAFNSTNDVLASSLAQATPGLSLGQAVMDARLRLLIPVTADAGTYTGTLTFTTV